jgi:hypothetical protein
MKKLTLIATFIAAIFVISSCTHRIVDFTVISTKAIDLTSGKQFERGSDRAEGVDMIHVIIGIPTGTVNLKEAIDRAIEQTPGAVGLIDGVVYSKAWYALVYGQTSYVVEGTPLIDPSLAEVPEKMPEYMAVELDKEGNVISSREVSEEKYNKEKRSMVKNGKKEYLTNY